MRSQPEAWHGPNPKPLDHQRIEQAQLRAAPHRHRLQQPKHLEQPHLPRRRLCVAHARLGCPEDERGRPTRCAMHSRQRPHLGRVAERCARAVRLDARQLTRRSRGTSQRREQQRALSRAIGRRQAGGAPVLTHRTAGHEPSTTTDAYAESHHERAYAVRPRVPIGARVERLAPPIDREHACCCRAQRAVRHELQAHRHRHRRTAFAIVHRVPCAMRSHE